MEPPTLPHIQPSQRRSHLPQHQEQQKHHLQQQQPYNMPSSTNSSPSSNSRIPPPVPRRIRTQQQMAPYTTVAQFSFAPTTQTTVVTTTTTTTTSFPPILMQPPRNLDALDPKEFPLAAIPTPSNLKRFCFDVNGKPTYFRETEDAEQSMRQLNDLIYDLRRNNGVIKTEVRGEERVEHPESSFTSPPVSASLPSHGSNRKRPASPVSISEAAERVATMQKGNKRRQTGRSRSSALAKTNTPSPRKHLRSSRNPTPSTPVNDNHHLTHAPRPVRPVHQQLSQLQNSQTLFSPSSQTSNHQQETPLTQSPQLRPKQLSENDNDLDMHGTPTPQEDIDLDDVASDATIGVGPNPPDLETTGRAPGDDNTPSSTAAQPLSLPSPSLSPVTAALTHGNQSFFSAMETEDINSPLELAASEEDLAEISVHPQHQFISQLQSSRESPGGLMEIPKMIDSFDAMPSQVKTYIMYQLLRRCSKRTLQTVAEVVNPALKCDFLSLLPPELSLNIIKYLDVKSLCSAAQVSKRWRIIIDSDEWTWKKLFDNDGYVLAEGELNRAVREGWGYQDPKGDDDCERDLNAEIGLIGSVGRANQYAPSFSSGRTRRKVNTRAMSKKQQKRRDAVETLGKEEFNEVISEIISNSAGPNAAADAAEKAYSKASVGLPSLRNLHLFKSIYRRHHIIRRSWIRPEVKPKHISFRGHQRHVVTCLQFDTDKILTGSDDTNINVYDTNSGALRTKLEGHEGGVWALQYEGNTLVSGSTDRTVRVWDIAKGECTQVFHGHTSTVRCLQILMPTKIGVKPDGTDLIAPKVPLIITGSRDSTLRVWKLPMSGDKTYVPSRDGHDGDAFLNPSNNPYYLRTLSGHQHSVRAISAHGDTLVSGSYDYAVKVWKISTGETIHTLRGHTQKVYSVVLDHKRNRCISGSMDNLVKVWSLETGSVIYTLEGHTQLVGLLDLSHDRLVSAAADSTLRIWDPESGQCRHTLSAHTGAITCFQHDGHKVISGSDRTLKMWNVQTGEFIRDLLTDLSGVWQVKFNERRCVAAVQRDQVTYIEVLDFGAARDGVPEDKRGRRIVVDFNGREIVDGNDTMDEAGDDFE